MTTQMVTTDALDKLRTALVTRFPKAKVDEVLNSYRAIRKEARLERYRACELEGGHFVEAVLKCFHYQRTREEVDTLPTTADRAIGQIESDTAHFDEIERLMIPKALRLMYTFRNKRGVAHNNSFDPIKMDCALVIAAANWVIEELTRLYLTNDDAAAQTLVASLMVKDIPLVEEIGDDRLVLKTGLSARIQLEILLYREYPGRCHSRDLTRWIHEHSVENVRTTLRMMRQKNLVHETDAGWMLTESGVHEAESEIAKLQNSTGDDKPVKSRTKGTRRVRK